MKKLMIVISLITSLYAQDRIGYLNKLSADNNLVLEKVNTHGEVYKITNKLTGRSFYKNLGNYQNRIKKNNTQVDTTVIYPDLVDTTQFTGMYEFWTSVPVGSFGPEVIVVGDVNQNGKTELYGSRYNSYQHINERSMYEYDPNQKVFEFKTDMPWDSLGDYGSFKQIYDVNEDGEENVFITGNEPGSDTLSGIRVARTLNVNDSTNLPTDILFDYKQWNQMNDPLWGEYDNREGTDLFYCTDGNDLAVAAARYNKISNSAQTVFYYEVPDSIFYLAGLSNRDIDEDGYADLVTGGFRGDIVIFEYNESIQNYRDVWYGDGGTFNVYIHFNSNDIDGNGKKEIWAGGAAFYDGLPITRLSCFEAIGNNQYETKHVIDIVGRFSFDASNGFTVDIDKDGTEEIGLCLDQTFMIFKFNGSVNEWGFDLIYLKLNDAFVTETKYFGATMYDIDIDGFEELLLMTSEYFNNFQHKEVFTYIYSPTDLVSVKDNEFYVTSYNLYQNYPNPFNPLTNIEYSIAKTSKVKIDVYNILGEKIVELVNKEQIQGNYKITFNGSHLPSGIYFIKMTAGTSASSVTGYSKTIKALLIK